MTEGVLYVVATPIGNLDDMTFRAVETLKSVDMIAAEDTRHSRKLLERYSINTRLLSLHDHNEADKAPVLIEHLKTGQSIALISDAGTPLISDPGYKLVEAAVEAGVQVSPVPGASAVTAALSIAAIPTDQFVFEGFLPAKAAARRTQLESLKSESRTLVFYESSHRIAAAVRDMEVVFGGNRQVALCRELTKRFETVLRGTLAVIADQLANEPVQNKGEFVVVLAGCERDADKELEAGIETARALLDHLPASQAAKVAAKLTGAPRRGVFEAIK